MRKLARLLAALAVPGLIALNAWQGWRYHQLAEEVVVLEEQQRRLLEANRNAIAAIAAEQSAARVEERAREMGLVPIDPSRVARVPLANEASP
jgi:ABC-type phosphate transport system auxiliary subunit